MKISAALTILIALSSPSGSARAGKPYQALEITPPGQTEPLFRYSESQASRKDPIVISVADRELRSDDRQYRVNLQKYWLQKNVPKDYKIQDRALVECPAKKPKQFGFCDEYVFQDSEGTEHSFFFFVGNWP